MGGSPTSAIAVDSLRLLPPLYERLGLSAYFTKSSLAIRSYRPPPTRCSMCVNVRQTV